MMKKHTLESEISYEDGVPLTPNVAAVMLLCGSDYDMGYQYARQINQIFGSWALKRVQRSFTKTEMAALKAFQWHIEKFTPEFIDMFRGMAAGATAAGVGLSYTEVLADYCTNDFDRILPIYPGTKPHESQEDRQPTNGCSGFAAWGSTTKDNKLICAGSSDHIITFQSIIVCLPETGNNYIAGMNVPRGNGSLCPGGSSHPAMNNKGLAYAHHGAGTDGNEEAGYSVAQSLQIQHTLRFANNADEALKLQLAYPRGERASGLWADVEGKAFVLECRDPQVVRRAGDYDEHDFLYASNTCLAEQLEPFLKGGLGQGFGGSPIYIPHGGWNVDDMNSVRRNLCMWNALHNYHGKVDLDFVKMLWHFPNQPPDYPTLEEADIKLYATQGLGWDTHIANLGNQRVGIMQPDNGDRGLYSACIGPAARQAEPLTAGFHFYQIAATHTFFELQLASKPEDIVNAAKKRAQYDLYYANRELRKLTYADVPYAPLDAIFNRAATENQKGDYYLGLAQSTKDNESVYHYAKAVRAFSRCQAYAKQVFESLVPPASKPTDLGLRQWFGSWGQWGSYPPISS
jgi:hypothetical protein